MEEPSMLDTVKMIRCVLKISSAFNDLDAIIYEKKYFKFKFKTESEKWLEKKLAEETKLKELAR